MIYTEVFIAPQDPVETILQCEGVELTVDIAMITHQVRSIKIWRIIVEMHRDMKLTNVYLPLEEVMSSTDNSSCYHYEQPSHLLI